MDEIIEKQKDSNNEKQKGRKRKENKKLIRLFLISDFKIKNRKLWPDIRKAKKEIIRNLNWLNIDSKRINKLFWIYAQNDQDIIIGHLKKYIPKFNVQMTYRWKTENKNAKDYLIILKEIREAFTDLKKLKSDTQATTKFDPKEEIFSEWQKSIAIEKEKKFNEEYQKKLWDKIVRVKDKIHNWNFNLIDVTQIYVFSTIIDWELFSFKEYFNQEQMNQEFKIDDLVVTLKDFIRVLKDLGIEEKKKLI